jgi:hypothetical protein
VFGVFSPRHGRSRFLLFPCGILAGGLLGCGDPAADAAVSALGPETPGVPPGPKHRPGQPCLVCHGPSGAARSPFSLAGTLYREKGKPAVLGRADVAVTEATGRKFVVRSNCAGNFYVSPVDFTPRAPFWVSVTYLAETIDMESPVYREGSCASCHHEPAGALSAGAVFLVEPDRAKLIPVVPCTD